jgi:hypothetical protein
MRKKSNPLSASVIFGAIVSFAAWIFIAWLLYQLFNHGST